MKKNNLIILAGGEKGPLSQAYGCDNKALLPIHGKPMLDWVIEAFQKSGCIDKIVVVGSSELDTLSSMKFVEKRIDSSSSLVRNILRGVAYIRWKYYRHNSDHAGYVISFCDAVFLTPEAIVDTISNIQSGSHDLVLHYVEKETYEKNAISAKRTYIPIDGKQYTGTTIYFVKKFSNLLSGLHLFGDLRKNRKDPKGLLSVMGLEDCTFT
jgi:molybdopterin-guanine dinucleotide biosynthesis protein A